MLVCANSAKQTQATGLVRNTECQVASVDKDVPYAVHHPDSEGPLEDQHASSPGLFHPWLAECTISYEGPLEGFLLV